MASTPVNLARITNHIKPRHQLYQPGFNPDNSCWLDGDWITLPEAEWKARRKAHQAMYANVRKESRAQSHRGKATPIKDLTPAQRQAWEFYAGEGSVNGFTADGMPIGIGIGMAGTKASAKTIAHIRARGFKVIRRVKRGKKVVDQTRGLGLPADIILDNEEPIDFTRVVVNFNRKRGNDLQDNLTEAMVAGDSRVVGMVFYKLIEHEENIIRAEWGLSIGRPDPYDNLDEERAEYVAQRAKLKALVTNFDEWYESSRQTHNDCARANLGDHGTLFAFVLPKFNEDGTHEPWGTRDVPWARTKG